MNIPKQKIPLKEKIIRYSLFTFFSSFFLITLTILAATYYPSVQPSGQTLGGKFKAYYDIIFTTCPSGYALTGFNKTTGKICEGIPVNGGWTSWSPTSCPTTCGLPSSTQTRTCTNPAPAFGGLDCVGLSTNTCAATAACSVDGVCSTTAGSCTMGTVSGDNYATCGTRTWSCLGLNGGTTAACSKTLTACICTSCPSGYTYDGSTCTKSYPATVSGGYNMNSPIMVRDASATYVYYYASSTPTNGTPRCSSNYTYSVCPPPFLPGWPTGTTQWSLPNPAPGLIKMLGISGQYTLDVYPYYTTNVFGYLATSPGIYGGTYTCPSGGTLSGTNCILTTTPICPTYTYSWVAGTWSTCSTTCGGGTQTRTVVCQRSDGTIVADSYCTGTKPVTSQSCNTQSCTTSYSNTCVDYLGRSWTCSVQDKTKPNININYVLNGLPYCNQTTTPFYAPCDESFSNYTTTCTRDHIPMIVLYNCGISSSTWYWDLPTGW